MFANLVGPELPDLIAGLVSLISLIAFVQFWKPKYRAEYAASVSPIKSRNNDEESNSRRSSLNQNEATAGNVQAGEKASSEKVEDTQIEDRNDESADAEPKDGPAKLLVQRPNTRETLLAWSPWALIVIVVIM